MTALRLPLALAALLAATAIPPVPAADKELALTAEGKKYLDGLLKEFLFDPKGGERVAVKTVVRSVWASAGEAQAEGWFVPAPEGKPGRVYFTDGAAVPAPAPAEMKKLDFKAACKARYAAVPEKKAGPDDLNPDDTFRKMRQTAVGALGADDLALAAWLYRLGDEGLAAQALAAARKVKDDPRKRLRAELAWSAFAGMVHAYMVRADEEALAHGERLLRLYPEEAKEREYRQAAQIVAELKRRQKKGTFGKVPAEKWPEGFDTWDAPKKAAYLIDALEEADARQWGQPGGVDLASDRRVEELIRVGDSAVPALIDALEGDERLTRSVHFWRDFARSRTVLAVREAVLTALMSILRVQVFEPGSTGDNFTARGGEAAKEMAKRLRAYWKEYGDRPFDERMMKVLTDPKANFEAKREAAGNLAALNEDRRLRTTIHPTLIGADPPRKPNPAVAKFSKPTAAEAILAALDADGKVNADVEGHYLGALVDLGDQRVAPEMAKRAAAAGTVRDRRQWALAAHYLGDPKPFSIFAEDFRAGKVVPPGGREDRELRSSIGALIDVESPEAERALVSLADPKHPLHKAVTQQVLAQRSGGFDSGPWFAHPFCLAILRAALDDTTPTGAKYTVEERTLWRKSGTGGSGGPVPDFLADPAARREQAAEQACDAAAEKLGEMVVGLPRYHPLFKDADQRLAAFKTAFDRFAGKYRRTNWRESRTLGLSSFSPGYIPDLRPLGRAATAEDVKAGKAVFHLDGKGKLAELTLPAVGILKREGQKERAPGVLIVQAEVGADGQATYGVIQKGEIRAVPGSEVTGIKSFAQLDKEEKEAAEKEKGKKD